LLLDACGSDLPDRAREADVGGGLFTAVVAEDVTYFSQLERIDAGGNLLPFSAFSALPRLRELRLPCNGLTDLTPPPHALCGVKRLTGYSALMFLDLSYNALSQAALGALAGLPQLQELDLTCNGLWRLPAELTAARSLERLTLERNRFEDPQVLVLLAALPALRHLGLAYNYLTRLPMPAALAAGAAAAAAGAAPATHTEPFPRLEHLDLAFNYVRREEDTATALALPRLARLVLYGNPLLGPTGEDPEGLRVTALLAAADARAAAPWSPPGAAPIDVITEAPRPPGQPRRAGGEGGAGGGGFAGRCRRPYDGLGIAAVRESRLPLAAAFRAAGNATLAR
ncbi:unnamed protein product, partial [Phaeothamnion confervicola]